MTDLSHVRQHVELLRHVKAEKAKLSEIEKAARAVVEEALGDAEEGTIDGQPVVRNKFVKSNRLDQKLLASLHPEVLAECKTVIESRRFEVL
ncbi:hypothetical protein FIONNBHARTH_60 [Mycobacterium phage Fionnbharth]|uniref:Uncharacterized protein n=2 Tax=Fionnbharthvirus TaxID=2948708 RepID=A0A6G6XTL3_9CAUD|nr:hypothetical protein ACQ59_gp73 [Mycobacterium phage Fionnbharth]YP_009950402.1 hypothetical protein I5G69_gp75 [Mycobacterium phage Eponine]AER26351.1 hypothetical protein FIONNBHARTH_60 [Mycobacterium phage Fionnbharth]QIG61833.1 hypothetical protein SEA_EPONINE_62 [Mycobacterium phage Eponine]